MVVDKLSDAVYIPVYTTYAVRTIDNCFGHNEGRRLQIYKHYFNIDPHEIISMLINVLFINMT